MTDTADRELLELWEAAQQAPPLVRPLVLLEASGENDSEALPIGLLDRRLLALREAWFGDAFEAVAECPSCGALAEISFDGGAIGREEGAPQSTFTCTANDAEIVLRLPDTRDLLAVAACADETEARRALATRCIVGTPVDALSDEAIDPIAVAVERSDTAGDLRVAIECPDCGEAWEAIFDPAAFLWRETESAAVHVLRDVDAIASAYGWSEDEILAMSRARRSSYVAMVTR